jgi:hypothetical protein
VNKSVKSWFVIILITIISLAILVPLLWVATVYFDVYPDSNQVVMIKPSVFRVDDILPKFDDLLPSRARYCLATAARIEAKTKATWIEIDKYYNERWNNDSNSESFPFLHLRLSTSTYGIFAFKEFDTSNGMEGAFIVYGIRSEIDFCKLNNWYPSDE